MKSHYVIQFFCKVEVVYLIFLPSALAFFIISKSLKLSLKKTNNTFIHLCIKQDVSNKMVANLRLKCKIKL